MEASIKPFGELTKEMQKEVISGYRETCRSRLSQEAFLGNFRFREKEFGDATFCLVAGNKLLGAITCRQHYRELQVVLCWAKPSKEFFKARGKTAGQALQSFAKGVAAEKGLKLVPTSPTKAGKRFLSREGKGRRGSVRRRLV